METSSGCSYLFPLRLGIGGRLRAVIVVLPKRLYFCLFLKDVNMVTVSSHVNVFSEDLAGHMFAPSTPNIAVGHVEFPPPVHTNREWSLNLAQKQPFPRTNELKRGLKERREKATLNEEKEKEKGKEKLNKIIKRTDKTLF